jgi:L-2-hydroxyglutarate oxidase
VPTPPDDCDLVVVGAGIVGLACARELARRHPDRGVVVLERADRVGAGQTGANSGVVHRGLYYRPGSLKARLCVEGAREMLELCAAHRVASSVPGKVVVATSAAEVPRLDELERRARANGVPGLRRIGPRELAELEPHVRGVAALHSPETALADFAGAARACAADLEAAGGQVVLGAGVSGLAARGRRLHVTHARGELVARGAVVCAGGAASSLARAAGAPEDPRIVPFRGAYFRLRPEKAALVRGLVYPVPDPALPFLGVHLTAHEGGEVLVGPTALLGSARALTWPGTWRMLRRHWRAGVEELRHALRPATLAAAARRFVPEIEDGDLEPAWAGTRAQAVGRDGALLDDFAFSETPRALHVRNAPSPAATSALAIARYVADRVERTTAW